MKFDGSINFLLILRYSTNSSEGDTRPFHDEPETSISILISTTVLHLDILCYALSTASTSTASYWSGVFSLLKFDHTAKKERFCSFQWLLLDQVYSNGEW